MSIAHPQWSENPHLLRMWEVIQPSTPLEDAHGHPHLGESSQMCRMRRFIWWGWATETAHAHSQWGEATQVHTMRLCRFTSNHSKKAHQITFLTKAKSMHMVRLLSNHKIQSQPTYTHPKRRKATSLKWVWEFIQSSTTSEKPPPYSHWRETSSVHKMQFLKCPIL